MIGLRVENQTKKKEERKGKGTGKIL